MPTDVPENHLPWSWSQLGLAVNLFPLSFLLWIVGLTICVPLLLVGCHKTEPENLTEAQAYTEVEKLGVFLAVFRDSPSRTADGTFST